MHNQVKNSDYKPILTLNGKQPVPKTNNSQLTGNNLQENCGSTVYFSDVISMWLLSEKIKVKDSTYSQYYQIIYSHIFPSFGNLEIGQINRQTVEMFITDLLNCGKLNNEGGLSTKTVSDILIILKAIIRYSGIIGLNIPCNTDGIRIKRLKKEMRVLTWTEQRILLDKIYSNVLTNEGLGIILSLYTGIRLGELCALKWGDICIDEREIKIHSTLQRIKNLDADSKSKTKIIISEPKSQKSNRIIPISEEIVPMLITSRVNSSFYVLTGSDEKFMDPRTMEYCFEKLINQCGIAYANYHSLRHTFATRCIEAGIDVKSLSEILGHSNVNVTLNNYVHSSFEFKLKEINKMSQCFTPIQTTNT